MVTVTDELGYLVRIGKDGVEPITVPGTQIRIRPNRIYCKSCGDHWDETERNLAIWHMDLHH